MAIFQIKVNYLSKNQKKGKSGGKTADNISYISRGSAVESVKYIAREGKYSDRDDLIHFEEKNVPKGFEDGLDFAETMEKNTRRNARLLKKYEMSLPREFTDKENIKIAQEFCEKKFGKDYVYYLGLHNPISKTDGLPHPHMHLSICERKLDGIERDKDRYFKRANSKNPEKGGLKVNEEFATKEYFENFCKDWEEHLNKYLVRNGYEKLDPKKDKIEIKNSTLKEGKIRSYTKKEIEQLDIREVSKRLQKTEEKLHENEKKRQRLYKKNIDREVLNELSGNKFYKLENKLKNLTMTKSKNYIKFQKQVDSHVQAEALKKEKERLQNEYMGTEKYFKLKEKKEREKKSELTKLNSENRILKNNMKKLIENRPTEEIKKLKENVQKLQSKSLKKNSQENAKKGYQEYHRKNAKKGEGKNHKENKKINQGLKKTQTKVMQTARLVTRLNVLKGIGNILKDDSFGNISSLRIGRMQSKYERRSKEKTYYFFPDKKTEKIVNKNIKIEEPKIEENQEQIQNNERGKIRSRTR